MAFLGGKDNIFEGGLGDDPERFFSLEITEGTPRTLTTHDQIAVVEARIHSIFSALENGISLRDPEGQIADLLAKKARHQIAVVEARIHSIFSALENGISLRDPEGQLADLIAEKARLIGILIGKPQQTAQTLQ